MTKKVKNANWKDWTWHIRHSIKTLKQFEEITEIKFTPEEKTVLEETIKKFPLSITPYYLSLIDLGKYKTDPVYLQSFPSPKELNVLPHEMTDPLSEDKDSPAPYLTHRYPDRVLLHVSNLCSITADTAPGKERWVIKIQSRLLKNLRKLLNI
jgi:lysine 2,3-aminomutase